MLVSAFLLGIATDLNIVLGADLARGKQSIKTLFILLISRFVDAYLSGHFGPRANYKKTKWRQNTHIKTDIT